MINGGFDRRYRLLGHQARDFFHRRILDLSKSCLFSVPNVPVQHGKESLCVMSCLPILNEKYRRYKISEKTLTEWELYNSLVVK